MENIEQEVKWQAPHRGDFRRFIRALEQAAGPLNPPAYLSITDHYLTDRAGTFSARKIALRIRRTGRSFEATLKTRSQLVNGLARREEYTLPLPSARSFSGAVRALAAQGMWHGLAVTDLVVRFVLRNRRRAYMVLAGDCVCEAALDSYVISAAGKVLKQCEIELELKAGPEQKFLELTDFLSQASALPRAQISKVASAEKMLQAKN